MKTFIKAVVTKSDTPSLIDDNVVNNGKTYSSEKITGLLADKVSDEQLNDTLANYLPKKNGIMQRLDTEHEGGQLNFERADASKMAMSIDVYDNQLRFFSSEGVGETIDFGEKKIYIFGKKLEPIRTKVINFGDVPFTDTTATIDLSIGIPNETIKACYIKRFWPLSSWEFTASIVNFDDNYVSIHVDGAGKVQYYNVSLVVLY